MAESERPGRSADPGAEPLHDPFSSDTIAAIATASGRSAVALIRLSGPDAAGVLLRMAPELGGALPAPRRQQLVRIHEPLTGELLDRSLVCFFPAPHSYTGQDVVEITTHGGMLVPPLVLAAALSAGARPAAPGEFTRRALFSGKLDLTQAEATLDLIEASSPALHRAAVHQLERGLARRIEALRSRVLRLEALIAYGIDFPEEDEPPVAPQRVLADADAVLLDLRSLLRTAPEGEMLREGALVVFAGLPNAGKSSLFNALLGRERSIVTEIPGTTRDAVEAHAVIGGFPFRLVDTAGLRDSSDRVESIGIEVARRYVDAADILVYCATAGEELLQGERTFLDEREGRAVVLVRTKSDLVEARDADGVGVSTVTGRGLDDLRAHLVHAAFAGLDRSGGEEVVITRARQADALRNALAEIGRFRDGFAAGLHSELSATHLREGVRHLETVIGAVTEEDVLDVLFGQFCVGK